MDRTLQVNPRVTADPAGLDFVRIISYSSVFFFPARSQGIPILVPSMKGLGCLDSALRHCNSAVRDRRVVTMMSLKDGLYPVDFIDIHSPPDNFRNVLTSSVVGWALNSKDNKKVLSVLAKDSMSSLSLFYLFHFFLLSDEYMGRILVDKLQSAAETYQWEDYAQLMKMMVELSKDGLCL